MVKKSFLKGFLGLSLLIMASISCTSELDLDQVNDLRLQPVIVGNLTYFEIKANEYSTNGSGQMLVDVEDFSPFRNAFLRNNLYKTELYFEVENTIQRKFNINLLFLNANSEILYEIPITVPASTGSEIKITTAEIFEEQKLEAIKQMTQVAFVVEMESGIPLTSTSLGELKLRSSATLYLEIE